MFNVVMTMCVELNFKNNCIVLLQALWHSMLEKGSSRGNTTIAKIRNTLSHISIPMMD